MIRAISRLLILVLSLGFVYSCSTTRYLSEKEYLLKEIHVLADSTQNLALIKQNKLADYIYQKPNSRFLGFFPWRLYIFNLSNPKNDSWFSNLLRKWGEEPVVYSADETEYSAQRLTSVLYNKGYLHANTRVLLDTLSGKDLSVSYLVSAGPLFKIAHTQERIEDKRIDSLLHPKVESNPNLLADRKTYHSLLEPASPLSANSMQKERRRISQILRNEGYYGFREENVYFRVDTTARVTDSWVETVIDSIHPVYRIGKISLWQNKSEQPATHSDSLKGINYHRSDLRWLKPEVLAKRIHIKTGDLYQEEATNKTYSALMALKSNSSVDIKYVIDSTAGEPTLDCEINTHLEANKEFLFELVGTNSSRNLGGSTSFGLKHKNLFHGSEEMNVLFHLGYENLGRNSTDHFNYGMETSLRFPRLYLPVLSSLDNWLTATSTELNFAYDYQTSPEFKRNRFSFNLGYAWHLLNSPQFKHELKLAEVDYLRFSYMNEQFYKMMPDITRMLYYRDQFVLSSSYILNYSSLAENLKRRSTSSIHNIRLQLQSSGALLTGISKMLQAKTDRYGVYSLMNINYTQFIRAELDYSSVYNLNKTNALAFHLGAHVVYPYGNSRILPIDLRYFSGGANSMRAWNVRSLGPGSMPKGSSYNIFLHCGDIKLDFSMEYRKQISDSWELATFLDAGNIWTMRANTEQPMGDFKWNRFYKEIALAYGLGLRWDLSYVLLRLDAGLKVYDPQEVGSEWFYDRSDINNLFTFHFALGYPF